MINFVIIEKLLILFTRFKDRIRVCGTVEMQCEGLNGPCGDFML